MVIYLFRAVSYFITQGKTTTVKERDPRSSAHSTREAATLPQEVPGTVADHRQGQVRCGRPGTYTWGARKQWQLSASGCASQAQAEPKPSNKGPECPPLKQTGAIKDSALAFQILDIYK